MCSKVSIGIVVLCCALNLFGCAVFDSSVFDSSVFDSSGLEPLDKLDSSGTNTNSSSPFNVRVDSENYDGQQLVSNLTLTSRVPLDPKAIAVTVRLFSAGEVVDKQISSLAVFLPEVSDLKPDGEYRIQVVGRAENLENYQVEVVWGEEAQVALVEARSESLMISVEDTKLEPVCEGSDCGAKLVANVRVVNDGKVLCEGVTLKAGLDGKWRRGSTEVVRLGQLSLAPGQSKLVKLRFSAVLDPGTEVRPHVEVQQCGVD